jgi:hypothetical protein
LRLLFILLIRCCSIPFLLAHTISNCHFDHNGRIIHQTPSKEKCLPRILFTFTFYIGRLSACGGLDTCPPKHLCEGGLDIYYGSPSALWSESEIPECLLLGHSTGGYCCRGNPPNLFPA